jgi:hypothetical protein
MHKVWLWLHSDTVEKWSDDMKLRLNHAVATICCLVFGSGIAQADTFDLDCVIKGEAALGIIDTNAVEQKVFGEKVESLSISDERVVIGFKREQIIVNRADRTVFVDGKVMENTTCEVKNYKVVAASEQQLSTQADSAVSSSELGEIKKSLMMLEDENKKLRELLDGILDVVEYMADRDASTSEKVLEKLKGLVD